MTRIFLGLSSVLLACLMVSAALASSDLEVFISNLNVQAQSDSEPLK